MVNTRKLGRAVSIEVVGAPSLVPKALIGRTRLTTTWMAFLQQLGLKLTPRDGIFVRTAHARMSNRSGWRAELHDPIGDFVSKYERRCLTYTVRLVKEQVTGGGSSASRKSTPRPNATTGRYGTQLATTLTQQVVAGPSCMAQQSESGTPLGIQDVKVVVKTEPVIKTEPEEEILAEDVKSFAQRRLSQFSNGFLVQVRNEYKKLKENNEWDRNVGRAPLVSYVIQELCEQ